MSFDILALDVATPSNAGREMVLTSPKTGLPLKDENGNEVTIILRGRFSDAYREHETGVRDSRISQMQKTGKSSITADEIYSNETDLLTICTVTWSFDTLGGEPFTFTPANAKKFWGDPRFAAIREKALEFIVSDANFTNA